MTKTERIIAAYNCVNDKLPDKMCEKCPYGYGYLDQTGDNYFVACNTEMIMADAIALLKAQEPRVMTLEEVKQERICWIEDADGGMTIRLFPATMFGIGEYANGSKSYMFLAQKPWAIDTNNCEWWYLIEDYGEIWRCWTSRPTGEQREAEAWK